MGIIGLGLWGAVQGFRRKLFEDRWFLRAAVAMGPAGFVAVICGWITAEAGRQPYTVYGLLQHRPFHVAGGRGAGVRPRFAIFLIAYAVVFSVGVLYILRLMAEGPVAGAAEPIRGDRAPGYAAGGCHGRRSRRAHPPCGRAAMTLDFPLIWAGDHRRVR